MRVLLAALVALLPLFTVVALPTAVDPAGGHTLDGRRVLPTDGQPIPPVHREPLPPGEGIEARRVLPTNGQPITPLHREPLPPGDNEIEARDTKAGTLSNKAGEDTPTMLNIDGSAKCNLISRSLHALEKLLKERKILPTSPGAPITPLNREPLPAGASMGSFIEKEVGKGKEKRWVLPTDGRPVMPLHRVSLLPSVMARHFKDLFRLNQGSDSLDNQLERVRIVMQTLQMLDRQIPATGAIAERRDWMTDRTREEWTEPMPRSFRQLSKHVACLRPCIQAWGPKCEDGMMDCLCHHLASPILKTLDTCVLDSCSGTHFSSSEEGGTSASMASDNITNEEGRPILHRGMGNLLVQQSRECVAAGYYVPGPENVAKAMEEKSDGAGKAGL